MQQAKIMLNVLQLNENKSFIGRSNERKKLAQSSAYPEAAIIVVYGRRRVGKTELIEQCYAKRKLIKIEGLEGLSDAQQRQHALSQISRIVGDPNYANLYFQTWTEIFLLLAKLLNSGEYTLYFEEVQWLANYNKEFISELKYVWDNAFRKNKSLKLILCGSSPSFMINQVMHSKALYNRSQFEVHLRQLSLLEVSQFLIKRSHREVMDAYLTVGGIPEYLKRIHMYSSIYLGLCEQSFTRDSYFSKEYQRIFISSLADSAHYQDIIEYLSKKRFATRVEIAKHLGIKPGGTLTKIMHDLVLCEFIEEYTSFHLPNSTSLIRYAISDNYLMFYFKFIKPFNKQIQAGRFDTAVSQALKQDTYHKWLGFSFERFCRKNATIIAELLGFSGIQYDSGAYFSKKYDKNNPDFQIDLIFNRSDRVITLCEIKYLQKKVDATVIEEVERKIQLLDNPKNKTIHKVLIAANGANEALINRHYFDDIITLDDFFK